MPSDQSKRETKVRSGERAKRETKPRRGETSLIPHTPSASGEARLSEAAKMEALGRLAGGVAHDFNNLLTVISGYAQLLLARLPQSDPLRPDVEEILKSSARGAALTNQLLAFSRRQPAQPRILDLNALIANTAKMLRRVIGENISLQTSLAPSVPTIHADPNQIEQILVNLAVNARDAMPKGGLLAIRTTVEGRHVVLSISDNGRGMSPDTIAHVFEPFFTTKEIGKGTGLGLSTVYGIVKQANGEITVESTPGQGATFRIFFPAQSASPEPGPAPEPAPSRGNRESILLVEDDPVLRRLLGDALQRENYQVFEAPTGEAALLQARTAVSLDLLVTDVILPGITGTELARRLPHLPVLFITGYTDDAVLETDQSILRKPFTLPELTYRVRELLDPAAPKTRRAGS